jgi:long-chain fatty acid transport protein
MRLRTGMAALAVAAFGTGAGTAQGAGFYIKEQSVTGLGRAFAGEAAIGEDASTIYFNPAAMTELRGPEAQIGVHLLVPRSELTNAGSAYQFGSTPIAPIGGGNGGNPYDPTPVPNGFAAMPFAGGDLWFGIGITAPFGLANKYDDGWFGRYDSLETELTTINVQPSLAYKVNDFLSVGGGIDIQYADAKLTNAIATTPTGPDILSDLEGDDWSVGFNFGILVKPTDSTRIGLHYRSEMNHELEGDLKLSSGGIALGSSPGSAELKLPAIVELGVAQELSPQLTLLGELTWYGWNNFDEIRVQRPGQPDSVVAQNYQNTWSLALGAQYEISDQWTVRGGVQYDQTPTEGGFRSTRTPDGDRTWVTAGLTYALNDSFVIDAAYAHIFISEETVDVTRPGAGPVSTRVRAETEGSVDIVSLALRYRF